MTQTELSVQDLASVDPCYWLVLNNVKLQGGYFSLTNHEYQAEPLSLKCRKRVYSKGTQGGFTEIEVARDLHGLIFNHYPQGVLHMFPTSDEVSEFGKSRFNPLITANHKAIGRYVQKTDTASLKKINEAFLYLRGARLTQKSGPLHDVDESSKLKSIPVDKLVFDEVTSMSEDVMEKARGRLGHSLVKEEVYISNPLLPDDPFDRIFQSSDQRHWFRKCQKCGEWTCAELTFPDCVKIRENGTGYIGCKKCGNEVFIKDGQWVAQKPSNTEIAGYRWSQLTSVYNDPAEILEAFTNPPEGNIADVYRLRLGLPYVASEDRLSVSDVLNCCTNNISPANFPGPCAMGVDVGKIKHVVIGTRTGNDTYEIIKTAQLSQWNDVHDLASRFGVKSAVIDIRPYEDSARQFQKQERYKIYLCEYSENTIQGTIYNDNNGTVKVNRTEIFDSTHRIIQNRKIKIPRECPDIKEFASQLCNTAKVLETNKRTGTSIYRYKKLGEEHYRNALNYFYLAASGSKIATVSHYSKARPKFALSA